MAVLNKTSLKALFETGDTLLESSFIDLIDSFADTTFETVAKSLGAFPYTINYTSGRVSSIVYTLPGPVTITKTINYTGTQVTSIVLSGATPSGIQLTKTLTYTGNNVTGVAYS
jgi:hypothetical protein